MKLIHQSTGLPVHKGDTVTSSKGEVATVDGWVYPRSTASTGRIGVIMQGKNTPDWFFPSVYGCEFTEREDRADEDAHAMLELNPEKVKALEAEYAAAVHNEHEMFVFDGHELPTSYAKYLIEYTKQRLGMK